MDDLSLWWIPAAIVGYFLGSINPASIIAKARGIDLRSSGSGNPGATNASRVMGRRAGILVFAFDFLKGLVPVLAFGALVGPGAGAIAGFAAILGHMTSPFLGFHGGKGVATTLGVLAGAEPLWLIPVLVAFVVVFAIVHRTGIASVGAAVALIATAVLDNNNFELTVLGVSIGALVILKHGRNIAAALAHSRHPPPREPSTTADQT